MAQEANVEYAGGLPRISLVEVGLRGGEHSSGEGEFVGPCILMTVFGVLRLRGARVGEFKGEAPSGESGRQGM